MTGIGADNERWVRPAGSAATPGWDSEIGAREGSSWQHTTLRVATLAPGESREIDTAGTELVVIPLSGSPTLVIDLPDDSAVEVTLSGRTDVFDGPTDVAYIPADSRLRCSALSGPVRVAVAGAPVPAHDTERRPARLVPFQHLPAARIPVEVRGAGTATRAVRNLGLPGVLDAQRLIVCEVITPAGNWSSWPPHKHDEHRPGLESELEEIYYFEVRATDPRNSDPTGLHRISGTCGRPIDVVAEVRNGDVVLVPHGWHGPSVAAPDADLYYLNVMAGPGPDRAWLICDHPDHGWVREGWSGLPIDPRLDQGSSR